MIATMFDPKFDAKPSLSAALKEELAHFELCPMCGQAVDRRDIHAVMHHLPVGHGPTPVH